jgi:hypothetical protein
MYWWARAAAAIASGQTLRAGLITTQSITQAQNRKVVAAARANGVRVTWAVADHAWCDGGDGAEVRVTMTVLAKDPPNATLVSVAYTRYLAGTEPPPIVNQVRVAALNDDLTAHADVASAARQPLIANSSLASPGYKLHGAGFIVSPEEASLLLASNPNHREIVRPYRNGKDLTSRPRGVSVLDFGLRDEAAARAYPVLFDIARDRVKPERDANARALYRTYWWRFGEARRDWRTAVAGLPRYIVTVETAKHRFFTFLDKEVAPDNMLVCVASSDAFVLGVLSSSVHIFWALAAGGALEDKPRYNKTLCFDSYPFPEATPKVRERISQLAVRLDDHRRLAVERHEFVTITGMYNVIAKLREGVALTPKERAVHEAAACGVLRDMHDELDAAVAEAYDWSWPEPPALILERLVALHDRRVEEETAGTIRWLRPEYQRPRFGGATDAANVVPTLDLPAPPTTAGGAGAVIAPAPWPSDAIGQITVLRSMAAMTPVSIEEAVQRLVGAKRDIVHRHLETLAMLGEVRDVGGGRYAVAVVS